MGDLVTLIAVALWCGEPINGSKGDTVITVDKVNTCRRELYDCIKKQDGQECFQKIEHPK
jgi:hypothetical protein